MGKTACLAAIRRFCLACMGGSPSLVRECPDRSCHLHPLRMGEAPDCPDDEAERPMRPVRRHCLVCAGGKSAARRCPAGPDSDMPCLLWIYRLGLSSRGMERLRKRRDKARLIKLPGLD